MTTEVGGRDEHVGDCEVPRGLGSAASLLVYGAHTEGLRPWRLLSRALGAAINTLISTELDEGLLVGTGLLVSRGACARGRATSRAAAQSAFGFPGFWVEVRKDI